MMGKADLIAAFQLLGDLAPAMRALEARGLEVRADLTQAGVVTLRVALPEGHPARAVRFQDLALPMAEGRVAEVAPVSEAVPGPVDVPVAATAAPEADAPPAEPLKAVERDGACVLLLPADPVAFVPETDLERHLWGMTRKGDWGIQADAELMHFACLDWPMQGIAAEMGRDAKEVKARFELLTEGRRRPRLAVQAALERMLAAAGAAA